MATSLRLALLSIDTDCGVSGRFNPFDKALGGY